MAYPRVPIGLRRALVRFVLLPRIAVCIARPVSSPEHWPWPEERLFRDEGQALSTVDRL